MDPWIASFRLETEGSRVTLALSLSIVCPSPSSPSRPLETSRRLRAPHRAPPPGRGRNEWAKRIISGHLQLNRTMQGRLCRQDLQNRPVRLFSGLPLATPYLGRKCSAPNGKLSAWTPKSFHGSRLLITDLESFLTKHSQIFNAYSKMVPQALKLPSHSSVRSTSTTCRKDHPESGRTKLLL